jgi:hypothetical protein
MMQYAIQRNGGDSRVINLSGRKRMLSQRLTKCVLALERPVAAGQTNRLPEVAESFGAWKAAHLGRQLACCPSWPGRPATSVRSGTASHDAGTARGHQPNELKPMTLFAPLTGAPLARQLAVKYTLLGPPGRPLRSALRLDWTREIVKVRVA